ncbi:MULTISPECIES: hypothetical protein [unclassified Schlesneria]|uniref:hypothetical protein n=1 Tax=unclassified Schlesneria TaxID=2762017 RepID=UPI002EEEF43B
MTLGNLTDGAGQLKMAGDKLTAAWEAARQDWNDVVSRTMEEEQLAPLLQQLRSTLDAVTRTSTVLAKAVRECEDEGRT